MQTKKHNTFFKDCMLIVLGEPHATCKILVTRSVPYIQLLLEDVMKRGSKTKSFSEYTYKQNVLHDLIGMNRVENGPV